MLETLLKAKDFQSPTPAEVELRSFMQGLLHADWRQALIGRGFGWHADVGAFSTPITGGGNGTVIDIDQPEFVISCPAGYTVIPLRLHVAALPGLQTTDSHESELLIAVDVAAKNAGDGTATDEAPTNMRSDIGAACPLTVKSAFTADTTDPTLGVELLHVAKLTDVQGTAATVNLYDLVGLYEPKHPPLFVGPCAIYGYWGGDIAVTGFANLDFLAIPSNLLTDLA